MYIDDAVELALREASHPYAKVGTSGYTRALCQEKTFTQRIRLVRHIQSAHVDSGIGKHATSKTPLLELALNNRGQALSGVGIATGTRTPSGRYLFRSAALISGWVRECRPKARNADGRGDLTSGWITDVDRHIAICPTSRGPSLLPVAYLKRSDFRRVGHAYYSQFYGRMVLAKAIDPATKGRPGNIRVVILRHYVGVGFESASLLPSDYRSTMQVMGDVISGPPDRAIRGRRTDYLKSIGEFRALRHNGNYEAMMSVMGQPGHGARVRGYSEAHHLPNERARVAHTLSQL